jgi:uncharacterized protein (DUF924 family)
MTTPQDVLDFWFGETSPRGDALVVRMNTWFGNTTAETQAAFDAQIRERFGADVELALRGELDHWAQTPRGRLALVVLLDQFPRNLFRGTARAFAGDLRAQRLVVEGCDTGADRALDLVERYFFYMPLQHAENADLQERSVAAFRQLAAETPDDIRETLESGPHYAEEHRNIIARFGRFPHRNAALDRESTAAERAYFASDAPDFGQKAH